MGLSVIKALGRHRPGDMVRFVVHLPNFVKLFLRLLTDSRVLFGAKALLVGAAVYALSPLDFIPDALPFLGEVDDLAIFLMACRTFIQLCPREVLDEHVARIDQTGKWLPFGTP